MSITSKPFTSSSIFTFQSGYIQIADKIDVVTDKCTLHSNLVIFK